MRSKIIFLLLIKSISSKLQFTQFHKSKNITQTLGGHMDALRLVSVTPDVNMSTHRILCWVNTYHKNHLTQVESIKATWGKSCDKLLFFSDIEDITIPTVRVIAPPTHAELWRKHRGVLKILYREYQNDYDWFFKCDDDTYVIMENLKAYLAREEITSLAHTPLLLGHRMTLPW